MASTSKQDSVDTPHPAYTAMLDAWALSDDLMGGTKAMKAAGTARLPKHEKEEQAVYDTRLQRSVLCDKYRDALVTLSRRPFAKPVTLLGKKLPEPLDAIEGSVDDERRNLTQFCHLVLRTGIQRGLAHILVDYPAVTAENKAQERELGLKPLLLCIDPINVIGWRDETAPNGERRLTQLRIRESVTANDGRYGAVHKQRIRMIEPDQWTLHEQDDKDNYVLIEEGPWSVGKITLVTIYFEGAGFMTAHSPLENLADLNLTHWQLYSDYLNTLCFAGTGVLFASGFTAEELKQSIVIGVNHCVKTTNPEANLRIVEHSGAAIGAMLEGLRDLDGKMDRASKDPLIVRSWGNETAMGRAIDEGKGQCDLQSWVRLTEGGVLQAYGYAADWMKTELSEDFGVDIYDDFGLALRSAEDMGQLLEATQAEIISHETYREQAKLRAILSETFDEEEEKRRLAQQGVALGMIGREES